MENLERLLKEHPFLEALSDENIRFLVGCAANRRFAAGERLFEEGQPAEDFYLIRRGRVALEVDVPGKGPFELESVGPDEVLGWSWLFPPHRSHIDARAVEPVLALAFDGTCLREKMESDHDLGYALTKLMLWELYRRLTRVRLQRLDVYRVEP